eukprot:SAG31_NODE_15227_length_764_cov_1.466165_1_plen_199_part_01
MTGPSSPALFVALRLSLMRYMPAAAAAAPTAALCHRYVVSGASDGAANGEYSVIVGKVDSHSGRQVNTAGRFQLCSVPPTGGPHYCDHSFELYSLPAWPAAGTWRIRGWDGKVEYSAGEETPAGAAPPARGWKRDGVAPSSLSVTCNSTDDDTFRPPRLVPVSVAELVWNQTADACPGLDRAGHPGEEPDSMPIAWHNP